MRDKLGRFFSSPATQRLLVVAFVACVLLVSGGGAAFAQIPTPAPVAVPDMTGTVSAGIEDIAGQLGTMGALVAAAALGLWGIFRALNMVRGNL